MEEATRSNATNGTFDWNIRHVDNYCKIAEDERPQHFKSFLTLFEEPQEKLL